MKRTLLILLLSLALFPSLFGQVAGEGVFNFLQLTTSAKTAALGGIQIALPDADPELILQNPALLSPLMNNTLSVNYARYLAGIGFGQGSFAKDLGPYGVAAIGIQFIDYGQFVAADETGAITGSFGASDYALALSYAKSFGTAFTAGTTVKPIYSHLENYKSFGLAFDAGLAFHSADSLTTFGLCIKNIGYQLTTYYDRGDREKIVWSLQLGYTHQLQHAPLRLSISAYDLNRWNRTIPVTDPNGIEAVAPRQSALSNVMRHLSIGVEIFPGSRVNLRFGYNHRRHTDLSVADQTGMAGFTTGLGINLTAIHFNYALSGYFQSGMVHNFSLSANLSRHH